MEDFFSIIVFIIIMGISIFSTIIKNINKNQQRDRGKKKDSVSDLFNSMKDKVKDKINEVSNVKPMEDKYRSYQKKQSVSYQKEYFQEKKKDYDSQINKTAFTETKVKKDDQDSGQTVFQSDYDVKRQESTFIDSSQVKKTKLNSALNNIDKLSPLQKAVIWSEILGSPKGLE